MYAAAKYFFSSCAPNAEVQLAFVSLSEFLSHLFTCMSYSDVLSSYAVQNNAFTGK